ncbi:MAG TPA: phosphatase PAP2 family protein [Mycobacteriales bacterium]|nr:phosphatase PAP2 family protein [Mycobacteriales bacterium]
MPHHRRLLWLSGTCLFGFAVLLGLVVAGAGVTTVDAWVQHSVDAHRNQTLTTACRYLTDVLQPAVDALLLAAGALLLARSRRRLLPLVAGGFVGWVMAVVVIATKHGVGRPAPHPGSSGDGLSFPSGHTASVLVCLGTLALLTRLWRPRWTRRLLAAVGVLTLLVAAALTYDNFHWLSDCVASILLGVGLLALLDRWLHHHLDPAPPEHRPSERRVALSRRTE